MSVASTTCAPISMPSRKRCGSRSEIEAVLEGAGFALVAIDRHQPRTGLAEHRAPFAARGKAGAAEAAQADVVERFQDIFRATPPERRPLEQRIAAIRHIGVVVDIRRHVAMGLAVLAVAEHFGRVA